MDAAIVSSGLVEPCPEGELSPITIEESKRFIELEKIVGAGISGFVKVGGALMEISEKRLYRADHQTFEAYCREKWDLSRPSAYRLIGAAKVAGNLSPMGDTPAPTNERQTRPLTCLEPALQKQAWTAAVEAARGDQPTSREVETAVAKVAPSTKTKASRMQPKRGVSERSRAMSIAKKVIAQIKEIPGGDSRREAALNTVAEWIRTAIAKEEFRRESSLTYSAHALGFLECMPVNCYDKTKAIQQVREWVANQ
jgi:hypothetical protein